MVGRRCGSTSPSGTCNILRCQYYTWFDDWPGHNGKPPHQISCLGRNTVTDLEPCQNRADDLRSRHVRRRKRHQRRRNLDGHADRGPPGPGPRRRRHQQHVADHRQRPGAGAPEAAVHGAGIRLLRHRNRHRPTHRRRRGPPQLAMGVLPQPAPRRPHSRPSAAIPARQLRQGDLPRPPRQADRLGRQRYPERLCRVHPGGPLVGRHQLPLGLVACPRAAPRRFRRHGPLPRVRGLAVGG